MLPNFNFFISKQFPVSKALHTSMLLLPNDLLIKISNAWTKVDIHVTFPNFLEKPFWKEIFQLWLWILVRFWDRKRLGMNQYFCLEVTWPLWDMIVVIVGLHVLHQRSMCTWHSDFCQLVTLTENKNLGGIKDQFDMFAYFQHLTRTVFPEDCMTRLCLWTTEHHSQLVSSLALIFVSPHY